jgi:hypothetical protein
MYDFATSIEGAFFGRGYGAAATALYHSEEGHQVVDSFGYLGY